MAKQITFIYITSKEHTMTPRRIIPVLLLAVALSACGGSPAASISEQAPPVVAPAAPPQASDAIDQKGSGANAPGGNASAPAGAPGTGNTQQQFERLVIKTAQISLQVESVRDAEAAVRAKVQALGGYVVKAENSGSDEDMTATITFRVPAQRFDESLTGLQGLAKKVLSRTVSGDDVTEEFVDLQSRLRNLEATRDRLTTFLDKATTVDEALKVNESLSQIQGEIEQVKGRTQYLKQSAALSTITVSLAPVPAVAPLVEEDGWQPLAVARDALRNLIELGQGLVNIVIVVLVWTPLWLPLVLLGWWVRRRLRGRVRKPAPTAS
jgi:uncharacterized protein DUF4349